MRTIGLVLSGLVLVVSAVGADTLVQGANPPASNFDAGYIRLMYQRNYDIAAIAAIGAQKSKDYYVRDFSKKVRREREDMNRKLAAWYPQVCAGQTLCADTTHPQELVSSLVATPEPSFSREYARSMIELMTQSVTAADVAGCRACLPVLKDQAKLVARTNHNESRAFQRWMDTGFLTLKQEEAYCDLNYQNDSRCPVTPTHHRYFPVIE